MGTRNAMILDDIVARRRVDVDAAKRSVSIEQLRTSPGFAEPRRGFRSALANHRRAIIAEVKKASPSRGLIRADFDPVAIARDYAANGAAAVSVLTEEHFFLGSPRFLSAIRAETTLPLLRKDFLFDPYQVYEARAWGADAVLLIVAMLDDAQLVALGRVAAELELDTLVEVHDADELARAQRTGATLIGINNRDLRTFATTLETSERLAPLRRTEDFLVAESGIDTLTDIERLEQCGISAFLVGESLMRAPEPGAKLRALLGGQGISTARSAQP